MSEDLVKTEEKPPKLRDLLPTISQPRCNVCKSNMRSLVDQLLIVGHSYTAIAKQLKGTDENFSGSIEAIRKSIERHSHRHLNVEEDAIRRIVESRARERGILVDFTEDKLANTKSVLDLIVAKGLEQVSDVGSRVKFQDVLKAVELLETLEANSVAQQVDVLQRQMWAIREAVRRVCPPELFPELAKVAVELFNGEDPFEEQTEVVELESGE